MTAYLPFLSRNWPSWNCLAISRKAAFWSEKRIWISLDSRVRNERLQWVARRLKRNYLHCPVAVGQPQSCGVQRNDDDGGFMGLGLYITS